MTVDGASSLFGQTFACECGRTHEVRPREVIYAVGSAGRLPEVAERVAPGRRVAVVMDARTREAAGEAVADALADAGRVVRRVVVEDPPGGGDPVCDEATKTALAGQIGEVDLIVPVGSGVVSDLGKWLSFEAGTGLVTFATAASMNGYASANVAPTIGGVKSLVRARPPEVVLGDPGVLADAPYEMTAAGLGDVLAKNVSSADWWLNHRLFGDYYCPRSVALIAEIEPAYLDHPAQLKRREPAALAALFDALLLTGVAMTLAETSAPASGGEHLISHSLDMMASRDARDHDLHGRQVGVGTIVTAELYRRVLAVESPDLHDAPGAIDEAFWGPLAGAVAARYAEKADRLRAARTTLAHGEAWDSLRAELAARLRPPEAIRDCLAAAGAATRAADIRCDRSRLLAAVVHAHEIRARFTVLDLANLLGLMPAAAEEILDTCH